VYFQVQADLRSA